MTTKKKAPKKKVPKKDGRPRVPIDTELLNKLAKLGCSIAEIASMMRKSGMTISSRTIERRLKEPDYAAAWQDGQNEMRKELRSKMWEQAQLMNSAGVHQAQFLAKNLLGMSDKVEHSGQIDSSKTVEVDNVHDRLTRKFESLAKRLASGDAGGATAVSIEAVRVRAISSGS